MSSATDHFNTDFPTTCKKIPRYSGELARQMADRFSLPFTTFTACSSLAMGLLNSHVATSFSPIDGFHTSLQTWYPRTADVKANVSMLFTDRGLLRDSAQAFCNFSFFFWLVKEECIRNAMLSYTTKRNSSGYNMLLFFAWKLILRIVEIKNELRLKITATYAMFAPLV